MFSLASGDGNGWIEADVLRHLDQRGTFLTSLFEGFARHVPSLLDDVFALDAVGVRGKGVGCGLLDALIHRKD